MICVKSMLQNQWVYLKFKGLRLQWFLLKNPLVHPALLCLTTLHRCFCESGQWSEFPHICTWLVPFRFQTTSNNLYNCREIL